jgi:hypothetical protein
LIIGNGAELRTVNNANVITTKIEAHATDAGKVTISGGEVFLTDDSAGTAGTSGLIVGAGPLVIDPNAAVIVRRSTTSYESVALGGVTLTNATFDVMNGAADSPTITLTTSTGTLAGNGGKLITRNTGALAIGNIATLKSTKASQDLLAGLELNTTGITAGTLSLASSAVLTINAAFSVGLATTGTGASVRLDVNTGEIAFSGAFNLVLVPKNGTDNNYGELKIGTVILGGLESAENYNSSGGKTLTGAVTTANDPVLGANDILFNGTGYTAVESPANAAMDGTIGSGQITISNTTTSKKITGSSKVGLGA